MSNERNSPAMQPEDSLTPEDQTTIAADDKKRAESDQRFCEMEREGWKRDGNTWIHPTDPEVSIYRDPYTLEELLSPKLIEQVASLIRSQP